MFIVRPRDQTTSKQHRTAAVARPVSLDAGTVLAVFRLPLSATETMIAVTSVTKQTALARPASSDAPIALAVFRQAGSVTVIAIVGTTAMN